MTNLSESLDLFKSFKQAQGVSPVFCLRLFPQLAASKKATQYFCFKKGQTFGLITSLLQTQVSEEDVSCHLGNFLRQSL